MVDLQTASKLLKMARFRSGDSQNQAGTTEKIYGDFSRPNLIAFVEVENVSPDEDVLVR